MAGRKKSSPLSVGAVLVIGAIVLLGQMPLKAWVTMGAILAIALAGYFWVRSRALADSPQEESPRPDPRAEPRVVIGSGRMTVRHTHDARPSPPGRRQQADDDNPVQVNGSGRMTVRHTHDARPTEPARRQQVDDDEPVWVLPARESTEFKVPKAPDDIGEGQWLPCGTPCKLGPLTIPGGMLYVGTTLPASAGVVEPALINPTLAVAKVGDYTTRDMGYWPSYSEISSKARRSYLEWLADGRKDPQANVGYVFLFFYGLERRVLLDAPTDAVAQRELPAIKEEILRLLAIYGENYSFKRYAGELLNWIELVEHPADIYDRPVPQFPRSFELPIYLRLALGRAAVDGVPVPPHLALAWARLDPSTPWRTAADRCSGEFDQLFMQKYAEQTNGGIVLPRNRTKLRFVYQAASAGFRGVEVKMNFGDVPDVSVLVAPIQKIRTLVEETTQALDSYSRYLGKNPNSRGALEGILTLPATLWPQRTKDALTELKQRMGDGMLALSFQELLSKLEAQSTLTREKTLALARALESLNIGIEPDVLTGAKLPKPDEKVVLFSVPPGEAVARSTPGYQAAALTLQLASVVATADGEFSVKEMAHLRQQVLSWNHLTPNHTRRLLAHLRLLVIAPATLPGLKKKLDSLDATTKQVLASCMAMVAHADGVVTPEEVKRLESIYKALGVDPKKVFSDVHSVGVKAAAAPASSPTSVRAPAAEQPVESMSEVPHEAKLVPIPAAVSAAQPTGFTLDAARIAQLQKESQEVSALLANIFVDDEEAAAGPPAEEPSPAPEATGPEGLMGLDEAHSALARILLQRPQWTRAELEDAAADLELMLEGALLTINEAAFDAYDEALTEGDDPVEVNAEILEKLEA